MIFLPHCGHYLYNNKIYHKREDAFDDMLINKDYNNRIEFYYNDHVFQAIDWTVPVQVSLDELYKLRAKQLRDQYKYLVLLFSGGADSSQILNTFLKHNIFIDEIICLHTETLSNKLDYSNLDEEMKYYLEYELASKPLLKKVAELSPNTKITAVDQTDFMVDSYVNKKYTHLGLEKGETAQVSIFTERGNTTIFNLLHYPETYLKDSDNIGVIRGFEKPNLLVNKTELKFYFTDITLHQTKSIRKYNMNKITFEDFYWSPNFPLIPIKQCQIIKELLETNYAFFNMFYTLQIAIRQHKNKTKYDQHLRLFNPSLILERKLVHIIYPDFNPNQFVAPKPRKVNMEVELINATLQTNAVDVLSEYKKYVLKKYDKIVYKDQMREHILSRTYSLGKLNFKWKDTPNKERILEILKSINE